MATGAGAMASLPAVQVEVWSDIACPWCYVGKARLDQAIERFKIANPPVQVTVEWHPYMIDTQTKAGGEEYMAYNQRRWGSDSWTHSLRRSGARGRPAVRGLEMVAQHSSRSSIDPLGATRRERERGQNVTAPTNL